MTGIGLAGSLLIGICLGFFGGGGSILTVPLLAYVFGLDPKQAIASSLVVVGLASAVAALHHWRAGNVSVRTAGLFGIAGMLGAYLGGRAGSMIDGSILLLGFAGMMLLTAIAMWRGRRETPRGAGERTALDREPEDGATTAAVHLLAQGLAVGMLTGLVGAGGGFLIVPALSLWAGLPIRKAVGTSLLIIVMNAGSGFAGYAHHVAVSYSLVTAVTTMAIGGSFLGSALAARTDPARIRRGFAIFVLVMAMFMLVRETHVSLRGLSEALPGTLGQLAFTLVVLTLGALAGRVSRRTHVHPLDERFFEQGGGI